MRVGSDTDATAANVDPVARDIQEITGFGANPGHLGMRLFVPSAKVRKRPLVVVLHGCTQTVEGFDEASGWSRLAARHDFLLLYPQQRAANNRDLCFSWFRHDDIRRGEGEVESIRQMIDAAIGRYEADARRVFVCGLSAGGAMAGALLATYPEMFAAGAIIAGLPYGTATNMHEAYESMSAGRLKDAKVWGDLVRAASSHEGPWPSVAVWHGTADTVVRPINAGELVKQWTSVHGVGGAVPSEEHIGKTLRRTWHDPSGRACVTDYSVQGLGHGAPVAADDPPAPFFLPAGISSTWHIAADWGLIEGSQTRDHVEADAARTPTQRLLSVLGF